MPVMGLIIVIIEALEHIFVGETLLNAHYLSEVAIYGIAVPVLGIILIRSLDRVEARRDQVEYEIDKLSEFNKQLGSLSTWDELAQFIVRFPKIILPVLNTCLAIYNPTEEHIEPVASWNAQENHDSARCKDVSLETCQSCILARNMLDARLRRCTQVSDTMMEGDSLRYCLPLVYRNNLAGLLLFDTLSSQPVTSEHLDILSKIAPEIAMAVDNSRLNSLVRTHTDATLDERQRIARDLHDTLGQNLSYLRLKLDQINSQSNPLLTIAELRQDLEDMGVVADEAYEQMRGTLEGLHPDSQILLEDALRSRAKVIGARANFEVVWNTEGTPQTLRPYINRQIQYIGREALNNIEKHAHAKQVRFDLVWGENDLSLTISDDGLGLNPHAALRKQNLGLVSMVERAEVINAQFAIDSEPDRGTTITLRVPLSERQLARVI